MYQISTIIRENQ